MNPIFFFIAVPVALFALFLVTIIVRYVPIIERNAFEVPRLRPPHDERPPRHLQPQEIPIKAGGKRLPAYYIRSPRSSRKLVIFCHETGADWRSWYRHARFLPDEGMDVLTFSYNGNGSTYQWPSRKELDSVRAVIRWAKNAKPGHDIALFGVSKGSALAASAASEFPDVQTLVLDGAFSTFSTMENYMRKWVGIYVPNAGTVRRIPGWIYGFLSRTALMYAGLRKGTSFFSIEQYAGKVKAPVLLIHAEKDAFVHYDEVQTIRRMIPAGTDLWVARNATHSNSVQVNPRDYRDKVMSFLRHFAS